MSPHQTTTTRSNSHCLKVTQIVFNSTEDASFEAISSTAASRSCNLAHQPKTWGKNPNKQKKLNRKKKKPKLISASETGTVSPHTTRKTHQVLQEREVNFCTAFIVQMSFTGFHSHASSLTFLICILQAIKRLSSNTYRMAFCTHGFSYTNIALNQDRNRNL